MTRTSNRNREPGLSHTPINSETFQGVIAAEPAGLVFIVSVAGRPIIGKCHPGLMRAPAIGDRVTVQNIPQYGIGLIIAVSEV